MQRMHSFAIKFGLIANLRVGRVYGLRGLAPA